MERGRFIFFKDTGLGMLHSLLLDQHAEGSGSCAEGGDGVSGESLETTGSYFAENERDRKSVV